MTITTINGRQPSTLSEAILIISELERVIGEVRKALDGTELRPGGTLAERVDSLDHHRKEWKNLFCDLCDRHANKMEALHSVRESLLDAESLIREQMPESALEAIREGLARVNAPLTDQRAAPNRQDGGGSSSAESCDSAVANLGNHTQAALPIGTCEEHREESSWPEAKPSMYVDHIRENGTVHDPLHGVETYFRSCIGALADRPGGYLRFFVDGPGYNIETRVPARVLERLLRAEPEPPNDASTEER